jgi:hypothetical protein
MVYISYEIFKSVYIVPGRPGSVVGIATAYGLDGSGIESRWGRDFPHLSRPALRPAQPPVQWVPGFSPGVRCGRGVTLTPHPLLVPRSKIELSYTCTLLKGLRGQWKGETYQHITCSTYFKYTWHHNLGAYAAMLSNVRIRFSCEGGGGESGAVQHLDPGAQNSSSGCS